MKKFLQPLVRPVVGLALVGTVWCAARGGDLNVLPRAKLDPPSFVSPTLKTLQEVEPRVAVGSVASSTTAVHLITQPGSYYLTGNVEGVAGKMGVRIAASHVTLDLNGFGVFGVSGSTYGVRADSSIIGNTLNNVCVKNGVVRGWAQAGVWAFQVRNSRFEDLSLADNGPWGLRLGSGNSVLRSKASNNAGEGLDVSTDCSVLDCTAFANGRNGIFAGYSCIVDGCVSRSNVLSGTQTAGAGAVVDCTADSNGAGGILVGDACAMVGDTVVDSGGAGIVTGEGSALTDSSSHRNAGIGIQAGSDPLDVGKGGCALGGCSASENNSVGIYAMSGCALSRCAAASNQAQGIVVLRHSLASACTSTASGGTGVSLGDNSAAIDCTASFNQGRGFSGGGSSAGEGGLFVRCLAASSQSNGFGVGSGSLVVACDSKNNSFGIGSFGGSYTLDNHCRSNNAVGIDFQGFSNRVEGNHVVASQHEGIRGHNSTDSLVVNNVAGICFTSRSEDNLIIRNSINEKGRYDVLEDNDVGTIRSHPDRSAPADNFEC